MLLKAGRVILIMSILAGQAKAQPASTETPTKSDGVISAILRMPKVKQPKPLAKVLNDKFWKMFDFTRPCYSSGERSLCASARPEKDQIPHVTVIFTWRF